MLKTSWRSAMAHKGRLFLSGVAIVLGVGFIVGTFIFTDTLKGTFDSLFGAEPADASISRDLGDTDPTMAGSAAALPDSLVGRVEGIPGVKAARGFVYVMGVTLLDGDGAPIGQNGPPKFGVAYPENPAFAGREPVTIVEGKAPAAADEIAVDTEAAAAGGLKIGDTVSVLTPGPRVEMQLVGLLRYGVKGSLAGATMTMFTPDFARATLMDGKGWTAIDLVAEPGTSQTALRDAVVQELGRGYTVKTGKEITDDAAQAIAEAMGFLNTFLLTFAGIALFVGTFIILNTFSMLVARRTQELALLRAIGALRGQVRLSVVVEALLLGLAGSASGVLLGIGIAVGIRRGFALAGAELPAGDLIVAPRTIIVGLVLGTLVTVVAAWFPARRASRIPPVAAMRDDVGLPSRSLRVRGILGWAAVALGAGFLGFAVATTPDNGLTLAGIGSALTLIGVVMVAPVMSRISVAIVGFPLERSGTIGHLAVRNAQRDRRRTAATATSVLIGLALITGVGVLGTSASASARATIDGVIGAEYIATPANFVPFSPEVGRAVAAVDGVAETARVQTWRVPVAGVTTPVTSVEAATITSMLKFDGDAEAIRRLTASEVVVDVKTLATSGLAVGDTVRFGWPSGVADLRITGTYEPSGPFSGWVTSIDAARAGGMPDQDFAVYARLSPDADAEAVAAGMQAVERKYPTVKLLDQSGFKDTITGQIDQLLTIIYALLGLSVIVAIVGVINTLALSVIERTREIGMLRAVGSTRRQVRFMITGESVVICLFGAAIGVAVGMGLGWSLQRLLVEQGISQLAVPWTLIGSVFLATAVVGVLAAVWPARRAARLNILDAIKSS